MAEKKKLFIHGGSSLISKYLIKRLCLEFNEIHIFCRDIKKTKSIIEFEDFKDLFVIIIIFIFSISLKIYI